jgi:hypothetical protein
MALINDKSIVNIEIISIYLFFFFLKIHILLPEAIKVLFFRQEYMTVMHTIGPRE